MLSQVNTQVENRLIDCTLAEVQADNTDVNAIGHDYVD